MKQIKNSFSLLFSFSEALLPYMIIMLLIPVLILLGLGISYLHTNGFLYFLLIWMIVSIGIYYLYKWNYLYKYKTKKNNLKENDILVEPSQEWSSFDNEIWTEIIAYIDKEIDDKIDWEDMQELALEVVSKVAYHYNPANSEKELAFSINELLFAVEEVSRRYRKYINEHIPFSNEISLSLLKRVYNHKDKLKYVQSLHKLYRLSRFINPATAIVSEVKGFVSNALFSNVSNSLQTKLKVVLIQEVTSVTIDLYSGKFKVENCNLNTSKACLKDKEYKSNNIEPLRVTVVGQVSSGKSSIINALVEKTVAEVSIIPSTDRLSVYECKIDDVELINLVDTPGLDGSFDTQEIVLTQMVESDLIFWVVKASQSARKLDMQLKNKFENFYKKVENRTRKKPKVLLLVNQVDKLKPIVEWSPPYDLINCTIENKKACIIRDATNFNHEKLNPDDSLALSIKPNDKFYNLNELKEYIVQEYSNGVNTQLNRRRLEHNSGGMKEQSKRFVKLLKQLFNL